MSLIRPILKPFRPDQLEALLFDLDGTLIDSMPHHNQAWVAWHARRQMAIDEVAFFAASAGRSNHEIISDLLPSLSADAVSTLVDEKEVLYREFARPTLGLITGAREMLIEARAKGLKLAVCTASTLPNMALAFERFGLDGLVDTVVSPADGLRGKPHPDIFLEAARRLGVSAEQCLVFEDAPLGIEAARRGGMWAIVLTTTLPGQAFDAFDNVVMQVPHLESAAVSALLPVK